MTCVRLSKENLTCSNNAPEIHIFNSWQHQKLLLVPNQLQGCNFLFEINSEDISINILVSQSKLLPSLFEHKDNNTIVMCTIIKKICHEIEAVYNWNRKDCKATLERVKTYLSSNVGVCSQ